jgi:hypothetical protein
MAELCVSLLDPVELSNRINGINDPNNISVNGVIKTEQEIQQLAPDPFINDNSTDLDNDNRSDKLNIPSIDLLKEYDIYECNTPVNVPLDVPVDVLLDVPLEIDTALIKDTDLLIESINAEEIKTKEVPTSISGIAPSQPPSTNVSSLPEIPAGLINTYHSRNLSNGDISDNSSEKIPQDQIDIVYASAVTMIDAINQDMLLANRHIEQLQHSVAILKLENSSMLDMYTVDITDIKKQLAEMSSGKNNRSEDEIKNRIHHIKKQASDIINIEKQASDLALLQRQILDTRNSLTKFVDTSVKNLKATFEARISQLEKRLDLLGV